jgi:hypothetical protein
LTYNGSGTYVFSNGDQYDGEWVQGMRTGYGRYTYHGGNGSVYEGHFLDNKKHGEGTLTTVCGKVFRGVFQKDRVLRGSGQFLYNSGDVFDGTWENGMREGSGKLYYASGNVAYYDGEWRGDRRHGRGVLMGTRGEQFSGVFVDGQLWSGKGCFVFASGNCYDGEWREGRRYNPHTSATASASSSAAGPTAAGASRTNEGGDVNNGSGGGGGGRGAAAATTTATGEVQTGESGNSGNTTAGIMHTTVQTVQTPFPVRDSNENSDVRAASSDTSTKSGVQGDSSCDRGALSGSNNHLS